MQEHLAELEAAGVRPVAISVDPPAVTRDHYKNFFTYPFLSDENAEVINRYQILDKGAGMGGHDVARPAEFLVDRSGVVRWRKLTEDYRVRTRPDEVLEAAKGL